MLKILSIKDEVSESERSHLPCLVSMDYFEVKGFVSTNSSILVTRGIKYHLVTDIHLHALRLYVVEFMRDCCQFLKTV